MKKVMHILSLDGRISNAELQSIYDWLKSLKDRIQLQPRQDWSEEDEATKNNISHIIRKYDKISKRENQPCWYIGDCLLWMQRIKDRVQPQPKTTWSEEDEEYINDLIGVFDGQQYQAHYDEEIVNWLKSLRPQKHWKPSKEQMKAIEHICDGNYNVDLDILDSIYRDFKKLREE